MVIKHKAKILIVHIKYSGNILEQIPNGFKYFIIYNVKYCFSETESLYFIIGNAKLVKKILALRRSLNTLVTYFISVLIYRI